MRLPVPGDLKKLPVPSGGFFSAGKDHRMKISDLLPLKGITITGPEKGGTEQGAVAPAGKLGLVSGEILKGQVVGFTPEGKVLLEIGGQTVSARSEVALKLGSELWFEVRQGGSSPWLSVAEKKGLAFEFLQEFLPSAPGLGRATDLLLQLAGQRLQGEDAAGAAGTFLQELVSLAQGAESRPEALARLVSWLAPSPAEEGGSISGKGLSAQLRAAEEVLRRSPELFSKADLGAVQRYVTLLEMQQQLNILPSPANQALYLIFPCLFALHSGWGEWMIIRDKEAKKSPGAPGFTLSFFLEMSSLGELQVQLKVMDKALQGDVVVAGPEVLAFFRENLAELQEILAGLGYGPVHFRARTGQTGMLRELKAAFENAAQLPPVRIVDVQA